MVYRFLDKKSAESGVATKPNQQLVNKLPEQIIRRFKRRKVYSSLRDNIWGVDFADMQSLRKYNKGIKYLLCVSDLRSKYAWAVPWKDKRGISVVNAFQKILDSSNRKANKIWIHQVGEFYNNFLKDF